LASHAAVSQASTTQITACAWLYYFWRQKNEQVDRQRRRPYAMIEKFGVEAFRYYLLSQIPTQDDGDLTEERMAGVYVSDLQNGLGNLVARVSTLCEKYNLNLGEVPSERNGLMDDIAPYMDYQFDQALKLFGVMWPDLTVYE
jgi:hypothetical protein